MLITVTREDVSFGRRKSVVQCPIALAAHRATGLFCKVGQYDMYVFDLDDNCHKFRLPFEATEFVNAFDKGYTPEPFTFDLPLEGVK